LVKICLVIIVKWWVNLVSEFKGYGIEIIMCNKKYITGIKTGVFTLSYKAKNLLLVTTN